MKKIIAPTLCTLMLFTLILITVGPNVAVAQDYERTSYLTTVIPTIDGEWTSQDEWTDGEPTWIGTDVFFTSTHDSDFSYWIVEFLSDTTDNSGDIWQYCIDGDQTEYSSPQTLDFKFEITGHTNIAWYIGNSGSWIGWFDPEDRWEWDASFSTSPTSSTPHWILEFQLDKDSTMLNLGDVWNFRLAVNDASNPGFKSWPPTSDPDVPDSWGTENYSSEPIPEGLTFAVMALLTTVSMLVGCRYFIKRKETNVK